MTLPVAIAALLDDAGRVVLETPLPPGMNDHEIDIAHLPEGVYVGRVGASAARWIKTE